MAKRTYDFSDETIKVIKRIREEKGFSSDTQTFQFIVLEYEKEQEARINAEEGNRKQLDEMGKRLKILDRNMEILMEILNTILNYSYNSKELVPRSLLKHCMMETAEKEIRNSIAQKKQIKDNKH